MEKLDAASLRSALETTFRGRGMQPLPSTLPTPPESWEEHYRRLAAEVEVEPDLDKAFAEAAAFLNPILAGRTDGYWDRKRGTWT